MEGASSAGYKLKKFYVDSVDGCAKMKIRGKAQCARDLRELLDTHREALGLTVNYVDFAKEEEEDDSEVTETEEAEDEGDEEEAEAACNEAFRRLSVDAEGEAIQMKDFQSVGQKVKKNSIY